MERIFLFLLLVIVLPQQLVSSDFFSRFGGRYHTESNTGYAGTQADNSEYYYMLGIDRSASTQQIRVAYRKKALELHPDKGGDVEAFKLLGEAYETLNDPQKRAVYDRYGKAGLSGGASQAGMGQDLRDLFRAFQQQQYTMPLTYNLEISLEDLFKGRSVMLELGEERFKVANASHH
jgi:DnaJ-class molecular chaperone